MIGTRVLAISLALPAVACALILVSGPAQAYPSHQCTATDKGDYCSCKKVGNHEEGNQWIKALVEQLNVKPAGKPWEANSLPANANWWPKPCKG